MDEERGIATINSLQKPVFLATTALEEFWDTSKPMLFLSEWCRLYDRKAHWELLNAQVLPNPWNDRERLLQAHHYTFEVYERVLPLLADWLNHIHQTRHDIRYWEIVMGPFLIWYTQALYDRYVHIQEAFDRFPGLESVGMDPVSFRTPQNMFDFVNLAGTAF